VPGSGTSAPPLLDELELELHPPELEELEEEEDPEDEDDDEEEDDEPDELDPELDPPELEELEDDEDDDDDEEEDDELELLELSLQQLWQSTLRKFHVDVELSTLNVLYSLMRELVEPSTVEK